MRKTLVILLLVIAALAVTAIPGDAHWRGGVYVERPPAAPPAPAAPTPYWYYCASAKGYYPTVPGCAEAWIKVPERPR
ncbi:MAG: hypothetical protein WEG40_12350 [Candidatus Rokuibacteriota bacterium]